MTILNIDRDYLRQTLTDLVRINSINPLLLPGGAGEREIAAYVTQAMQQLGMSVAQHEPAPDRISVVGALRGSGGGRSLMLTVISTPWVWNTCPIHSRATFGMASCMGAARTI